MREDLVRELEADYEDRRRENERIEQRRREEIRGRFPELGALMNDREQMIYGTLRGILRGDAQTDGLPERMEALSARIRSALEEKGYPANYLAPIYTCPLCRDTGYVGEPIREPCACMIRSYQQKLRERAGLNENNGETFEAFDPLVFPDTPLPGSSFSQRILMQRTRELCETWANTYPDSRYRDILLTGASGLGKTFLLHAMASRLLDRGIQVRMISAFDFLQAARKSYFENDAGLRELLETQVLMLDDLGSEPMMQNITIEQLFYLLNERQMNQRATVISTNLDLKTLRTRYTERISSRITDQRYCAVVPLLGVDIRQQRGGKAP